MNLKNEYNLFKPEKQEFKKSESKRYDTEEEYKDIENKTNVHSRGKMNKDYNKEKTYINILKNDTNKKKPTIVLKKGNPNFKSMKDVYIKEIEMMKLVNPELMKREEYENEKRDGFLKRKIDKNRKISAIKEKYNKAKRSRINSAATYLVKELEN